MIRRMLIPLAAVVALAAPASAQAISSSEAAEQAQLYFQMPKHTKPGTYNPGSFNWNCDERFFGWACSSYVRMYPPICQPPIGDGRVIVEVHMNHRGTGRRFHVYHCSRFV